MRLIDGDRLKAVLARSVEGVFGIDALSLLIDVQPAIDSVKHGKWITVGKQHIQTWQMVNKCSVCGNAVRNTSYIDSVVYFDYCPHCGAKMGGEEE